MMKERKQITMAGLVQAVLELKDGETLYFKRSCDFLGWGITKVIVLNLPFLVLKDYARGVGYSESLPVDYCSSDFIKDFIGAPLLMTSPIKDGFYIITEEETDTIAFLYEEPDIKRKHLSFMQFAKQILDLKTGETIDFYTEEEDGNGWGVQKLRALDADIVVFGIYGGGETYSYDLTGDGGFPEELEAYLTCSLQCHTLNGVFL